MWANVANITDILKGLNNNQQQPQMGSSEVSMEESILHKLVANQSPHGVLDKEIMLNSEEDYWNSVIQQKPKLEEQINNIRRFPREVVGDAVRYQIPMRHDDGTVDKGWRTMDLALEDYNYIYQRTALSNP